jgi:hypothetical protein
MAASKATAARQRYLINCKLLPEGYAVRIAERVVLLVEMPDGGGLYI